jgi:hypothetical protein
LSNHLWGIDNVKWGTDPEATLAAPPGVVREEASSFSERQELPSHDTNEDPYDCHIDQVYDALFESMDFGRDEIDLEQTRSWIEPTPLPGLQGL